MNKNAANASGFGTLCAVIAVGASFAPPARAQYTWSGGTYNDTDVSPSAPGTLLGGQTLSISGSGLEFNGSGGLTTDSGSTVTWTGGTLGFQNGAAVSNSGLWNANSSSALSMYDGGYGGTFTNTSTGKLQNSGSGALTIDAGGSFSFQSSGTVDGGTGSIQFDGASYTQTQFGSGSVWSGQVLIGGNGAQFAGSQTFSAGSNVDFSAGYFYNNSPGTAAVTLNGNATWTGGVFYNGAWTLSSGDTLTVDTTPGGNTKALNATSFTNNGTLQWTTADSVLFQNGSTLTNNGSFIASAATTLVDGGYGGTFVNIGTFEDNGGGTVTVSPGGSFAFQNAAGGTIETAKASDSIIFSTASYTQATFGRGSNFSGPGTITIQGNGATFDGSQNIAGTTQFVLAAGYYVPGASGAATLNGNASWTGGVFYGGAWTLPSGDTLTVDTMPGGNTKALNGTSFTNNGTIQWTTADAVLFQNGSTLTNNGGFIASAATTFVDGGYGGTFVNTGTFEDKGGGTVTVSPGGSFAFQNAAGGTIETAQASDSIIFSSASYTQATFANNTNFSGPGTITIQGNGAAFTGNQNVAGGTQFVLASGYYVPGGGGATLNGTVNWTGGQFYGGSWNVASGSQLNVSTTTDGSTKYFNATAFTNSGTLNWATADPIFLANGAALVNNGTFTISQDASFADGGYGGTLVNNGLLSKTGGTGTTSVAPTGSFAGLANNGVTQVLSGSIGLGTNFTNPGTLAGSGTLVAGTLTNNGTVAPGTYLGAPATLSLTGNYVQGTGGTLGIGANGTTNGLFAVSGTATLAGTVDVTCVGHCIYSAGTELLILSSSGLTVDPTTIVQNGFTGINDFSLLEKGNQEFLVVDNNVAAAVPEPGTYATLLAGLGLLGGAMRRRASRRNS